MAKNNAAPAGNKMGHMPMPKLLITMAAPMILSMLVQALYNVVDSYYVSRITAPGVADMADKAVSALTLVFPVQMLITGLCVGTGVGVNAALSKSLGARDHERAGYVAGNSMLLGIGYYVFVLLFGIFGTVPFLKGQTSDPITLQLGIDYMTVITVGAFCNIGYMTFEKLLQATGKTVATMCGQMTGAVMNIILDPIFIFGKFGLPAMGVKGAAVATVLGQGCGAVAVAVLHFALNKEVKNSLKYLRPHKEIIVQIYRVGAPAIVMQTLGSVSAYGVNVLLGSISGAAIAAYGIYNKLQNFLFMPCIGLNNASIPVIGFNFGARNRGRIRAAIGCGLGYALAIMAVGTSAVEIFAPQLAGIFDLSAEAFGLCVQALRIISAGYVFVGANVILQGVCQALGNGMYSLVVSILRQAVIVLPAIWLLSGLDNAARLVWAAFPAAELIAFAVAAVLTAHLYKKRVADMA